MIKIALITIVALFIVFLLVKAFIKYGNNKYGTAAFLNKSSLYIFVFFAVEIPTIWWTFSMKEHEVVANADDIYLLLGFGGLFFIAAWITNIMNSSFIYGTTYTILQVPFFVLFVLIGLLIASGKSFAEFKSEKRTTEKLRNRYQEIRRG